MTRRVEVIKVMKVMEVMKAREEKAGGMRHATCEGTTGVPHLAPASSLQPKA
jgi:hypothetical protein